MTDAARGPHARHPLRGYLYIMAACFLWGVAAALGRFIFTNQGDRSASSYIDPLVLSETRTAFTFAVLFSILVVKRGWRALRVPRADLATLAMLGVFGLAMSNFTYYLAIERTNVATAIMLQYTAPVWVLLYLALRGKQKPTLRQVAAVVMAICGVPLLIDIFGGAGLRLDKLGVAAAILAAFAFAFYNIAGHDILQRSDRWTVLLYVTGSAALFWLVINPPWKLIAANYSQAQWVFLALFALISALGPFTLYASGLQHLEPTRAMIAACMEPVFAIAIAALALGEGVSLLQAVGIVMVLAAIIVVELPTRARRDTPTAVEPIE
jgi:drug/metabolite transporter (DMT)-like permease